MKKIINLYKPVGLTPLQAIEIFREKHKEYSKVKLGYAGRLDPMAEGVLMVLVGEENKKIGNYLKFDKEYRAEILIGLKSDSCDVLGLVEGCKNIRNIKLDKAENLALRDSKQSFAIDINNKLIKELKKKLKSLKGYYKQKIPHFSSYRIKGKPMFYYALRGKEIEDVKKVVEIKDVKINSIYKIGSSKLLKYIINKIDKVNGEFRQEEIKNRWKLLLEKREARGSICYKKKNPSIQSLNILKTRSFLVIDVTISCSSGTYIRAIADDVGKEYGGGLLLSLKRTRVGRFDIRRSLRLKNKSS